MCSNHRINWILATSRLYPYTISFSVCCVISAAHSFDEKESQRARLYTHLQRRKKAAFFKCRKMPTGYGLNCIDCFAMIWNVHWNKRTEWYGTVWYNERVCMLLHTQYQIKSISQNYSYNSKCPQNLSKLHFIDILFIWLRLSGSFCWTKQKKNIQLQFCSKKCNKIAHTCFSTILHNFMAKSFNKIFICTTI